MSTTKHQNIVEEVRLICTDLDQNNNKFWHGTIIKDGAGYTLMVDFGRVGYEGAGKPVLRGTTLNACQSELNKRADGKRKGKKKGGQRVSVYTDQRTVGGSHNSNAASGKQIQTAELRELAVKQIAGLDKEIADLVRYLSDRNVHNIKTATTLNYDDATGLFSTPLGVVTQDGIDEARTLLDEMSQPICDGDFGSRILGNNFNGYMRLIPTKVSLGRKSREQFIQSVLPDAGALQKQTAILDSLEASLKTMTTAKPKSPKAKETMEKVFDVSLEVVNDKKLFKQISDRYRTTAKANHDCSHLNVKKVYRIRIGGMDQNFKKQGAKLDNIWQLWHGTRVSNLLSILHGGFMIPPAHAKQCTGRMYGDGLYGSDISTKALNYAYGFWDGGKRDNNCFALLMDFAMGKYYSPDIKNYSKVKYPVTGYHSTYAKAGFSGVQNNEMIVYQTSQCNPRYLVQFG